MISHGVEISIAGGGADEKDEFDKKVVKALCMEVRRGGHKHCSVQEITANSLSRQAQNYCYRTLVIT